jgi:hypothetical protein
MHSSLGRVKVLKSVQAVSRASINFDANLRKCNNYVRFIASCFLDGARTLETMRAAFEMLQPEGPPSGGGSRACLCFPAWLHVRAFVWGGSDA